MPDTHTTSVDQQRLEKERIEDDGTVTLTRGGQLGDHMLILGAFLVIGGQAVALNGADHRQAINGMAALGGGHNAAVRDQVMFQPHALHILGDLGSMGGGLLFLGTVWHGGGPFLPTESVRRAVQNPAIP